jgi:hypothetical protein
MPKHTVISGIDVETLCKQVKKPSLAQQHLELFDHLPPEKCPLSETNSENDAISHPIHPLMLEGNAADRAP